MTDRVNPILSILPPEENPTQEYLPYLKSSFTVTFLKCRVVVTLSPVNSNKNDRCHCCRQLVNKYTRRFHKPCSYPQRQRVEGWRSGESTRLIGIPSSASTAVKRLGQFFVSFLEISFTLKWKQYIARIYIIAVECKCISFFPHKRVYF